LETFFPTVFINREQVSEENFSETCFYVEESNSTIYEREHRNWGETRYNQAVEQFIPVGLEDYPCWHYAELEEQDLKNPFFPELLLNAAELSLITAIQQVTNLVANIKPKPFPIVFDSNTGLFFLAGSILTPYLNETEFKELEKKHSAAMQDLVYADSDSEQPAEPKLFVSLGDEWFFRQIRNNQNQLLLFPELEGLIRS
jgi:hypothetical protein